MIRVRYAGILNYAVEEGRPYWFHWYGEPMLAMPCGKNCVASLSGHKIAADGTVSPSAACPSHPSGFHEFITLENYRAL